VEEGIFAATMLLVTSGSGVALHPLDAPLHQQAALLGAASVAQVLIVMETRQCAVLHLERVAPTAYHVASKPQLETQRIMELATP